MKNAVAKMTFYVIKLNGILYLALIVYFCGVTCPAQKGHYGCWSHRCRSREECRLELGINTYFYFKGLAPTALAATACCKMEIAMLYRQPL